MFHKLFFLPFHCQFPQMLSVGSSIPYLLSVCKVTDHKESDILSLFLLSVKMFGKLFSPEDSYN